MTSSIEIKNYFKNDPNFLGCFPFNDLPPFPQKLPAFMIINTDKKNQPGEHWLGLVLTNKKCFYFDSFGVPIMEEDIVSYLRQKYKKVTINNECIQHFSSASCGLYCIAFVKHVKSKQSFESFISNFDFMNLLKHDNIVLDLI